MRAEHVAWVTGELSPNRTASRWAVGCTDLGICWDAGGWPHVLFAVGDSFHQQQPQGGGGGTDWRCNLLAWSHDRDLTLGMDITGFLEDRAGHARQFIPRTPGARLDPEPGWTGLVEKTVIPTGGCSVQLSNGWWRNFCSYMSVHVWGDPGKWTTNHAGIAYSDDGGVTWAKPTSSQYANTPTWDQRFQMTCMVPHGNYVLVFGTPNGRQGSCYLARVHKDHVLDLSRHEQWCADGWRSGNGANDQWHTVPLFGPNVSELSVMYHQPTQRWLAAYFHEGHNAIVVHRAAEPTGPWGPAEIVATAADFPGLYGAFWHPWTMGDPEPSFFMSQWDPYNVELMRLTGLEEEPPAEEPEPETPSVVETGYYVYPLPRTQ